MGMALTPPLALKNRRYDLRRRKPVVDRKMDKVYFQPL
jgi:hypothetical protein